MNLEPIRSPDAPLVVSELPAFWERLGNAVGGEGGVGLRRAAKDLRAASTCECDLTAEEFEGHDCLTYAWEHQAAAMALYDDAATERDALLDQRDAALALADQWERKAAVCRQIGNPGQAEVLEVTAADLRRALGDALRTSDPACTGASTCRVRVHIHGCFADAGSCEHPEDHGDASPTEPPYVVAQYCDDCHNRWIDGKCSGCGATPAPTTGDQRCAACSGPDPDGPKSGGERWCSACYDAGEPA